MDTIWKQGNWTVYLDELFYLNRLGHGEVGRKIEQLLTQGRSKGITVVSGMQRPVGVTRFAMSESTHLISFGIEGRDAKKTMREVGNDLWAATVEQLERYEFAWFYVPERAIFRGRVQDLIA